MTGTELSTPSAPRERYREIRTWLEELCATLAPGSALPSETKLAKKFGVSRMTARHALETLRSSGVIERRQGAGSFVAQPALHRQESMLRSFSEEIRRRGETPSSIILDQGLRTDPGQALLMGLAPHDPLVRLDRVRCSNGVPMAREVTYLPKRLGDALQADLAHGSLHETLQGMGVHLSRATGYITSRLATDQECMILRQEAPMPLLIETRTVTDSLGEVVESTETAYIGSRWAIDTSASVSR